MIFGMTAFNSFYYLFIEFLEPGRIQNIIKKDSKYFQYIEDAWLICSCWNRLLNIKIEPSVEFTSKEETDNTIPF